MCPSNKDATQSLVNYGLQIYLVRKKEKSSLKEQASITKKAALCISKPECGCVI